MAVVVSREAFLKPQPRRWEDVPLPELGEGIVVPVRSMTARERTAFEKSMQTKGGTVLESRARKIRELLIVEMCRDRDGTQIFKPEDVEALSGQDAGLVERIVDVCMRLSGLRGQDMEELEKNSVATNGVASH